MPILGGLSVNASATVSIIQLSSDGVPFQCFRQLRPRCECLFSYLVRHPLSAFLVLVRPEQNIMTQ